MSRVRNVVVVDLGDARQDVDELNEDKVKTSLERSVVLCLFLRGRPTLHLLDTGDVDMGQAKEGGRMERMDATETTVSLMLSVEGDFPGHDRLQVAESERPS